MYRMFLLLGGAELEFPVLPEKIQVSSPGKNAAATVLEIGDINRLRLKGLRDITFESFFPVNSAPYVTGAVTAPGEAVRLLQAWRDEKKPARFLMAGGDLDINSEMGIEAFTYSEQAGEAGDIYYSLTLRDWKDYSPRRVKLMAKGAPYIEVGQRSGSPEPEKTHAVSAGDCLWDIAQKYYGDGSRYPELYEKNKTLIDGGNKGTGNPRYTIYPGQKFIL